MIVTNASGLAALALFGAAGVTLLAASTASDGSPAKLRQMAADYYKWRDQSYPIASSDAGLHTWDAELTDYSDKSCACCAIAPRASVST